MLGKVRPSLNAVMSSREMLRRFSLLRRRRWRAGAVIGVAGAAALAAYLADTLGEATLRLPGVVVDAKTSSHSEFRRFEAHTVSASQSQIAIPGRKFWWDGSFAVGSRVAVDVVDGRFSGWRYISDVEPPEVAAFHDALDEYKDEAKQSESGR